MKHVYRCDLNSFDIANTRSAHEDTDYVSFSLQVTGPKGHHRFPTQKKYMGNVNNGHYPVGLHFDNVAMDDDEKLVMNYIVINSGHGKKNPNAVLSHLERVGSTLVNKGAQAAASGVGAAVGTAVLPVVGTAIGAAAGWVVSTIGGMFFADCDGTVAVEQVVLSSDQLEERTSHGKYSVTTRHPGTDSPWGCGSNSDYRVSWTITRIS